MAEATAAAAAVFDKIPEKKIGADTPLSKDQLKNLKRCFHRV